MCFSQTSTPRRQPFGSIAAGYVAQCNARRCLKRATLIAEIMMWLVIYVRQIELCLLHCEVVIERERSRGLEISDRRKEWRRAAFRFPNLCDRSAKKHEAPSPCRDDALPELRHAHRPHS